MRRKTAGVLVILILGALVAALARDIHRAFWSTLALSEILNFESKGWLESWTSPPRIKEFTYAGPSGRVKADLYLPQPERKCSGILLNHGVIDTGKDDRRLKRLAEILCRSGFVVCVPDFRGMRSFRISPTDIDEIRVAFENLISLQEHVLPQSCGLFGFSYGAGPAIIAACRPAVQHKVRFVVSFGGYYDLKNTLSFIATGIFEFQGKTYSRRPQEYGKWVFLASNLDLVQSPADRSVLRAIVLRKLQDERSSIDEFRTLLGDEGETILALLSHSDPGQTERLINKLPPQIRASMEALSLAPVLPRLRADLILAHGEDDDMIPFTETLRLAQAAPDPRRVHMRILKSYSHVDPDRQPLSVSNLVTFHFPEGWKLFRLVDQLLSYR